MPSPQTTGRPATEPSDALNPEKSIFTRAMKPSAERSNRREPGRLRSAMSVLNAYLDRKGESPSAQRKPPQAI